MIREGAFSDVISSRCKTSPLLTSPRLGEEIAYCESIRSRKQRVLNEQSVASVQPRRGNDPDRDRPPVWCRASTSD